MPGDTTGADDIKSLLLKVAERFLDDIKKEPPYVDHTLSLHVILVIIDKNGDQLRFGAEYNAEMQCSPLRDALSDWWREQSEDNFKLVNSAIDNLFESMFAEGGKITFNGVTEPIPTSLNVDDSYFQYFAGDITDPGDPIIESGASYYLNGQKI